VSKTRQLAKNTFIIALGKFSTQFISFFLLPLYTYYLSPVELGLVDLMLTYIVLLAPVVTIQMEMAAFRFLIDARNDKTEQKNIISSVIQITLIAIILVTGAYLLAGMFVSIPYFWHILMAIYTAIFAGIFLQFARGFGDNKRYSIASVVSGVVTLSSVLILVVGNGYKVSGVLTAIILSNLVCSIYLFKALRLYEYISLSSGTNTLRQKLIKYSSPLVANGISWWVINVSDRTIIAIVLGLSATGIYAVSNKYAAIFAGLFYIFSMAWTESISVHINSKDRNKFISDTGSLSIKLFGSLGLMLIALTPFVFNVLISKEFNDAYYYVPILIIAALFNAIVGLYSGIYVAMKLTKKVMHTSIIAAIINIVLTLILVQFIGIYGAAIATAVAFGVMAVYRHYDLKQYVNIKYEQNLLFKVTIIYMIVTALSYLNNSIGNIINVVIALMVGITLNKGALSHTRKLLYSKVLKR